MARKDLKKMTTNRMLTNSKRMLKKVEKIATSSKKPKTKVNKAIKSLSFKNTRKKITLELLLVMITDLIVKKSNHLL